MTTFTGAISSITAGTTTLAAPVNNHRDALKALSESWTAFGSGSSWTAATGNPVLNDGTWLGLYRRVNKAVDFVVVITMGASTTYGTGQWRITPPVTPRSGVRWSLDVDCLNSGVAQYTGRAVYENPHFGLFIPGSPDALVGAGDPFVWGSTDILTVSGSYEAA